MKRISLIFLLCLLVSTNVVSKTTSNPLKQELARIHEIGLNYLKVNDVFIREEGIDTVLNSLVDLTKPCKTITADSFNYFQRHYFSNRIEFFGQLKNDKTQSCHFYNPLNIGCYNNKLVFESGGNYYVQENSEIIISKLRELLKVYKMEMLDFNFYYSSKIIDARLNLEYFELDKQRMGGEGNDDTTYFYSGTIAKDSGEYFYLLPPKTNSLYEAMNNLLKIKKSENVFYKNCKCSGGFQLFETYESELKFLKFPCGGGETNDVFYKDVNILEVRKEKIKIKLEFSGKFFVGWVSPYSLCANYLSTCS